jgi:hypothetical protein
MKPFIKTMAALAATGLLALAAGSASAAVSVTYVQPEKFADMPFSPAEREDLLAQLTAHFKDLGKSLAPGQDLRIEVLDFDPAGRLIPNTRFGRDLRVLNGRADWPRMHLRYALEQDGQVLKSGEAELADMNYQQSHSRYFDSEPLRYEKQMVDDWFTKTIGPIRRR